MPVETRKASKKNRGNEGRRIVGGAHEGTLSRMTTNVLARLPDAFDAAPVQSTAASSKDLGR